MDTCTEICGDGKRFNSLSTYWDDGNASSGDGCNSSWSIENGWIWTGGNTITKDTWTEVWGDGVRFNSLSTYCDDGNVSSGDGWSSTWTKETGWMCSGGNSLTKDICIEICGDGKRFNLNSTYCDDNNMISGDGWSSNCSIELGWNWLGGNSISRDKWAEIWGDGIRINQISSYWDDGNNLAGDGWNSLWIIESGWKCLGGNSNSKDLWSEIWGDGKRYNFNTTYWDDGNKIDGDGWSSSCIVESNYIWSGGSQTSKDLWFEIAKDKYSDLIVPITQIIVIAGISANIGASLLSMSSPA